jgi:hypothetical protein
MVVLKDCRMIHSFLTRGFLIRRFLIREFLILGASLALLALLVLMPKGYAESVKLSAIVPESSTQGYTFTALAPLPKLLPDASVSSSLSTGTPSPAEPKSSTFLDVKKKP